ncbi:MAG: WYL domain-containing protein [Muribaculaceae bacterium]|nr:WYL domain-containing protein [Muribaculaceae bacterium]
MRNTINCYLWLVDTIRRYGRITLAEISRQWQRSPLSDGKPMPRRTFHTYRNAAEQLLDVNINCDRSTFEYYIEDQGDGKSSIHDWLLNSMAVNDALREVGDVSGRVVLENVPSARHHLPVIIDALKQNVRIQFAYKSYTRSQRLSGVTIEPYFVKIFKQLWYVIGYNVKDRKIKTYALDRMSDLTLLAGEEFVMPSGISPQEFFKDCFGITTNQNKVKHIILRVEPTQAKYFRALPLHPSQEEEVHDSYSVFHYRMRITYDLREELLSHGSAIEVIQPPELKTMIREELQRALEQYQ